jgi:hypothetical protein
VFQKELCNGISNEVCVASVRKKFTLKGVKLSIVQHLEQWTRFHSTRKERKIVGILWKVGKSAGSGLSGEGGESLAPAGN